MRQVFASSVFRGFYALVLGLFLVSQAARGQGKADFAPSACVPSDLSALIVPEGGTVQVNEVMEFGKHGSAANKTLSCGPASGSFDARGKGEAYKIFSKEAQQGNPAAMTNLAVSSLAAWGGKPNAGAALYWLHAAADRGYGAAFYDLGILYFKGCGVRQDMAEAFHFFELGAEGGYHAAEVNLGYVYDHGLGVAQDHAAAARWYLQAAEA